MTNCINIVGHAHLWDCVFLQRDIVCDGGRHIMDGLNIYIVTPDMHSFDFFYPHRRYLAQQPLLCTAH